MSVGGDCLQTAAVLAGLRRAGLDPLLVWLDAHGDFNTPETSPRSFIGGMPLAMPVGRGEAWLRENVGLAPISERVVILSDARDLDPGEAANLADSQVEHVRAVPDIPNRMPERGFLVQGEKESAPLRSCSNAWGRRSVTAIDAVSVGDGRYGAIFWVAPKDVKKAAALLGVSASTSATVGA